MTACPFARRIRYGSKPLSLDPEPLHSERALARRHMWKSRANCLATIFRSGCQAKSAAKLRKNCACLIRPSAVSMLTAAATPNPTGRETRSPTSLLDLPHLDTAGGPKVRRGDPRARGGAGPKTPCTREGSCNPKRLTQYHFETQNCDQRGQPMRWGRPRDLAQVRICKKTTTITTKTKKSDYYSPPYTGYALSDSKQCYHLGA